MNAPDRFELFLLAEGERKIEEKVYSGMSNTSDFLLKKEDHTLGHLLSEHLKFPPPAFFVFHRSSYYKVARHASLTWSAVGHPNVPELFIRVQTDGTVSSRDVFTSVCEKLINQLEMLHQKFTREWELRRIANTGNQAGMQSNGL
ncbi:DNA-directed RNA polymerase, RBP11-like protein [Cordyceps fumosorosea ARSEF 2679]|uniref:DNA-directed RNA polymerase, RBP11-like protein n=1 Tax=Cordyceps fumosorosea (strain ARSEF 2679) TaxID=1081104 RepID=A0A168ENY1_CORFA|nr:DNA-directed RNA polymerase, RBP11-like protein [Cordyceps fumosorosea ARSEF 2679]OAA74046.1 DNA-directed RNA polymerase, RBP11-like protein [Cordyceps fumosorosea ARSEF 2679]